MIQVIDRNPDNLTIKWIPGILTPEEQVSHFRELLSDKEQLQLQQQQHTLILTPPPALPSGGLRIVALGGLGEIGRNMTVFEFDGRLLIVDCGVLFPEADQPGVDLILPDFAYLDGPAGPTSRRWCSPTATRTTSARCRTCSASAATSRWSARSSPWPW